MLETHGGGRHYVPDDDTTAEKGVNAPRPRFRSLENSEDVLLLVQEAEDRVAPVSLQRGNLASVLRVLDDKSTMRDGSHLAAVLRTPGATQEDVSGVKLYDRLIPDGTKPHQQPSEQALEDLAEAMLVDSDPVSNIPAAYTYFGQFLAHDMSYMKLVNEDGQLFWTNLNAGHALQFESLFGTVDKPGEPSSEWVTTAGASLGVASYFPDGVTQFYDLPRRGETGAPCCRDPRADSNLGLAQMHVLLVRFHQALASKLKLKDEAAQQTTKQHLQAVVLTDFLRRLVPTEIFDQVMYHNRRVVAPKGAEGFLLPIEFAAAVFRFGHSMIRNLYKPWVVPVPPFCFGTNLADANLRTLLRNTSRSGGLSREGRVKSIWCTRWKHMIGSQSNYPNSQVWARGISASLARSFATVDAINFPDLRQFLSEGETEFNLAKHTLSRAQEFELPSGQALAAKAGLTSSLDVSAFLNSRPERFDTFTPENAFCEHTPLWFYILAEAEDQGDGKLGPLGGRIVMETFHAALESDPNGILKVQSNGSSEIEFEGSKTLMCCKGPHFSLQDVVRTAYT